MKRIRIVILAKVPKAGFAKSRLIPLLGVEGAQALAQRLLEYTVAEALQAGLGPVELCLTPDDSVTGSLRIPETVQCSVQGPGDLGERMARIGARVVSEGDAVILIGTDCPALNADRLRQIAEGLSLADTVLAPAVDGGYVALGLNRFHPILFSDIPWSTDSVAFDTLCRLGQLGWSVHQLPMLHDIDRPDDIKWLPAQWSEARVHIAA